ncbi:MAG: hypothetical protein BRC58_06870 [Cyanobacteria bacterium QS_8_64_29]|nr:MAG: hypothetical protein BRC58_06870 [Cyanobacteria bacterium QS_8_64_29]
MRKRQQVGAIGLSAAALAVAGGTLKLAHGYLTTAPVSGRPAATAPPAAGSAPEATPIQTTAVPERAVPKTAKAASPLEPVPLDPQAARERGLVDVRGVGDSGMALTYKQPRSLGGTLPAGETLPEGGPADFGHWLDALDPSGRSYRGHLSFLNWESVVGERCNRFRGTPGPRSYAFVSHPANLQAAHQRGFNLIGLANNHTQDCPSAPGGVRGTLMSARQMVRLERSLSADWVWHGVGRQKAARVRSVSVGDRSMRVAFAGLYMGGPQCRYAACAAARSTVLESLQSADADLRILSIHSWNAATQQQLVETGEAFLRRYGGDIVFGHGPHVWRKVRAIESRSGERGILFESLGNFLHPSLAAQRKNIIGRVLLDRDTLEPRQVQVIPVATQGVRGSFARAPNPARIPANRDWQTVDGAAWRSGAPESVRGAYFNWNGSP